MSRVITVGAAQMGPIQKAEGREVTGWPVLPLSRGEVVWDGASPRGVPGRGRFLPCDLPAPAKPQGRFVSGFDPHSGDYTG